MRFIFLFLLLPIVGMAQPSFDFKIYLEVSGNDGLDAIVENQLNKELTLYDDIVFSTEEDSDYFLDVMVIDLGDRFVATYMLTEKIKTSDVIDNLWLLNPERDTVSVENLYKDKKAYKAKLENTTLKSALDFSLLDAVVVSGYSLLVDPDLKGLCEQIISGIDYNEFRKLRSVYDRFRN